MTREQGEALLAYIDAAITAALAAHTVGRHDDSQSWETSSKVRADTARDAFVALLP